MQFPSVKGFQSTLVQEKKRKDTFEQDKVQIIHSHGNHWIVATTIEATSYDVKVFDSVFDVIDDHTALLISNLYGSLANPKAVEISKQLGANIDNTHPYGCEINHVRAWFSTEYKGSVLVSRA